MLRHGAAAGVDGVVRVVAVARFPVGADAVLLRDGFHGAIQLVHGFSVGLRGLSRLVNGPHVLEIGIMSEGIRLEVIGEERRRVVVGGGAAGEGTVG